MKKLFIMIVVFAAAICSSVIMTSCKKKETDKTIYGAIYYKDSTSVPIANTSFSVHVNYKYGYPSKESNTAYTFSTDANGYFNAKYKSPKQASIHLTYIGQSFNDSYFWSGTSSKMGGDFNAGKIYAPKH